MIILIIIVAVVAFFIIRNRKKKKGDVESTPQPQQSIPTPQVTESKPKDDYISKKEIEFNLDLRKLFHSVKDMWCYKKECVNLYGVGVQYHYDNIKLYVYDYVCGTIEREPDNPKDKRAIRFADINGTTIAYIPKDSINSVYEILGNDFTPRPFIGKIVWNDEGKKSVLCARTYGNLLKKKEGSRQTFGTFIESFTQESFDYYNYR